MSTDEWDDIGFGVDGADDDDDGVHSVPKVKPFKRYDIPHWLVRSPISRRKTLCGLEWQAPYWVGEPVRPFRPEGLLCPDAPPGARVLEWSVGADIALPVSRQPVFLSSFLLLAQLDDQARDRCQALPHLLTCEPGAVLRIRIVDADGAPLGPPLEPTVWGITAHPY